MSAEYTGYLYVAHKDILAIEALAQDIDTHSEVIAFHAQQAAEKMLKNVFETNGVMPAKTHRIDDLLTEAIDKAWLSVSQEEIRAAIHLSHYAVAVRYTDTSDIGRGEAVNAILDCNRLSEAIERGGYLALKIDVQTNLLQ